MFLPPTYRKVIRVMFVVDLFDVEFATKVLGQLLECIPSPIEFSRRTATPGSERASFAQSDWKVKRNITRDNIEHVKLAQPKTTRIGRKLRPPFVS
jgi:hypothetical protein